jgi:hypothetical protein
LAVNSCEDPRFNSDDDGEMDKVVEDALPPDDEEDCWVPPETDALPLVVAVTVEAYAAFPWTTVAWHCKDEEPSVESRVTIWVTSFFDAV